MFLGGRILSPARSSSVSQVVVYCCFTNRDVAMAWPPKIQAAQERMEQAQTGLRADIESGQPYDSKRRNKLLKKFNLTHADFMTQVIKLAKKSQAK